VSEPYPLEVLLELREAAVDKAQRALADQVGRLDSMIQHRDTLEAERDDLLGERRAKEERFHRRRREERVGGGDFASMRLYLKGIDVDVARLGEELTAARQEVAQQESVVAQHRQRLADAKAELEVVERHRGDWEDERARMEKRREHDMMDEIGTTIWRGGSDGSAD
jgi:flagellar biosynthesis chaperone FliJ